MHNDSETTAAAVARMCSRADNVFYHPATKGIGVAATRQLSLPGIAEGALAITAVPSQVARWVLRVLARTEALQQCYADLRECSAIAALLGIEDGEAEVTFQSFRRLVMRQLDEVEARPPESPGPLQLNIELLTQALSLSAFERELLELRAQIWTQRALTEVFHSLFDGTWPDYQLARVLAVAFDVGEGDVWPMLGPECALARAGLLRFTPFVNGVFAQKVVIQQGLSNALQRPARDVEELLSFAARRLPEGTLDEDDFPHWELELETLTDFLRSATQEGLPGANVLLHGPPGVGKSELVRLLPSRLGLKAFEVRGENSVGAKVGVEDRLDSYRMTQALLGGCMRGAIVVLDDIDSALMRASPFRETSSRFKPWINRLLETNALPALWIANDIGGFDPAYVRRFDIVLELKTPPRSVRQKIIGNCLRGLPLPPEWIDRRADDAQVSPAIVARTARVLRTIANPEPSRLQATHELLIRGQQRAVGQRGARGRAIRGTGFRPELLNLDLDVGNLVESLRRRPQGNLLLHGPPGTGKTEFAHYLARAIDRPLLVKRASDLIAAWIGETERNLAAMFEEAASDGAVLLLDEADSFFQDRRGARHQWEVTQVNEILTQMEEFEGLFVCATNAIDSFDPAGLRRFGIKLGFRPLLPVQAMVAFADMFRTVTRQEPDADELALIAPELQRLRNLTPGDFLAVRQCWALLDQKPSPADFLDALRKECALKLDGGSGPIGF